MGHFISFLLPHKSFFRNNRASQLAQWKNISAKAGDAGDVGSIPGLGRFLGEENGNPLQNSYLENPMDRGAWWATVHGVIESETTEQEYKRLP